MQNLTIKFGKGGVISFSFFSLGDTCHPAHMLREIGVQKKHESFPLDWFGSPDFLKAVTFFSRYDPEFFESVKTKDRELEMVPTYSEKYNFNMPYSIKELTETSKSEIQLKYKFEYNRARRIANSSSGVFFFRREIDAFNETKLHKINSCKNEIEQLLKEFCQHDNIKIVVFPDFPTDVCKQLNEKYWICLDRIGRIAEPERVQNLSKLCGILKSQSSVPDNEYIYKAYCKNLTFSFAA